MKIFMSWRSRSRTRKLTEDEVISAAVSYSSCPTGDGFILQSTDHGLLHEHLQPTPDHDQRLCGVICPARPTQPADDEQQPAWPLPQDSAHDGIYKLSPQDIYSSGLLRDRRQLVRQSSDHGNSSTKAFDMDLLVYHYTLQNALLSIGTLGGELLGDQLQEPETEKHNTSPSFHDCSIVGPEDDNAYNNQGFLEPKNGDLDAANKSMALLYIKNGLQCLQKDSTLDDILKGICVLEEIAHQPDPGDVTESRCPDEVTGMMEPPKEYVRLGSFKEVSDDQKIIDPSKNTMGGSFTGIRCHPSSSPAKTVINYTQLPQVNRVEDIVEEEDKYSQSVRNAEKKLASATCNHRMDLKRLIIALTPNCVAKRLLKRLKLVPRQAHAEQSTNVPLADCNYQCKFYKFMRVLGIHQSRIPSNVGVKRELGPLAISYDDLLQRKTAEENWIRTDNEYVVLELDLRKPKESEKQQITPIRASR